MIISNKNRYIFIAVPKTGTTSIQKLLLEHDSSAQNYSTQIDGKEYQFKEHSTALEIKNILGPYYSEYRTFGFVRNPYSRIVSSYFFYRNGTPITSGNKKPWPARMKMAYARLMPFKLWALSYPYRSNIEHLVDENGDVIVDFIGTFENLENDLLKIFDKLDLKIPTNELKHVNSSRHQLFKDYFKGRRFMKSINKLIQRDLEFYNKYKFNL